MGYIFETVSLGLAICITVAYQPHGKLRLGKLSTMDGWEIYFVGNAWSSLFLRSMSSTVIPVLV